jgi:uncharacterized SAM-binding protein YcdF (DUF218 family)
MEDVFFLISKLAWGLLSPLSFIFALFTVGTLALYVGKQGIAKIILSFGALISTLLWAYPIGDVLMYPLESRFTAPMTMPVDVDGIIQLGGGEELVPSISWNTTELGEAGDRYLATASLAKRYPDRPILFTGGSGFVNLQNNLKEAEIAQAILSELGVDTDRIILESESRNTFENFVYVKSKLPKRDGRYLLVTSAFHQPRAVGIARKLNINVIPYPVDYRSHHAALRDIDFRAYQHFKTMEYAWKEWIGLTVYYFTGKTSAWFPK